MQSTFSKSQSQKALPSLSDTSHKSIRAHLRELCLKIGDRRAGSPADRRAAKYVLQQFASAGLQAVHSEAFSCVTVVKAEAELAIGSERSLRRVPARVLAGSPSTSGDGPIETDLVWVEMPEQARRVFQPSLGGKVIVMVGPMPTRAELHRRLVACRPAAVVHVDDRLPFDWVKDDGVYPAWARRYGMPPTVTIPYRAAWELRKAGAARAKIRVRAELKRAQSHNLIGEIPGRQPDLPLLLLGAHHDTQCNNSGADDNASGVVALLELGRLMTGSNPLRTIRLVSFGAEEQLSVGSARYVGTHRGEVESIGAVINLDSVSSPLGHHWMISAGQPRFASWMLRNLSNFGLETVAKTAPMPFADHFPFSAFGVPAITLMRPNMDSGMRWQHHSAHDTVKNVSIEELAKVIRAVAGVTTKLAKMKNWPFGRGAAPEVCDETRRLARELFGFSVPHSALAAH
jgi:hypothetical protein